MPLHNNLLIIIDILTETLSSFIRDDDDDDNVSVIVNTFIMKLYLFLFQDLAILAATLLILLQFFREDILRDGKTKSLLVKHWSKIIVCFLYLIITITIQVIMVTLSSYENDENSKIIKNIKNGEGILFFISIKLIQRFMAIVYYFDIHKNIKLV